MNVTLTRILNGTDGPAKTARYRPDHRTQNALLQVNEQLRAVEERYWTSADDLPDPPIVIVAYVPRSGSTLLTQLLARSGNWNYISNFQARFWLAPYVGGLLERAIMPRDPASIPLDSEYGLTQSPHGPAEFSYFWERWLQFSPDRHHELTVDQWRQVDVASLRKEIRLIGSLESRPLFFKKEWLGMNAGHLLSAFPTAKVLYITRNEDDVARSIKNARREVFGDSHAWWGARPAAWSDLVKLPERRQIVGQIAGIRQAIERAQLRFSHRFLTVTYEALCDDMEQVLASIDEWAGIERSMR